MKASNLITHLEKKGLQKEVTMVIDNKEYSIETVSANPDKLILSGVPTAVVPTGEEEEPKKTKASKGK